MMDHLKTNQSYPVTRENLVAESDKQWFKENLAEGTYNSADEVIEALGLADMRMGATA